jgi:hypothetical protein
MDQRELDALKRQSQLNAISRRREIWLRANAAMAAVDASLEDIAEWRKEKQPPSFDNPRNALRGVLLDLFEGCWDSGFASGENRPER